MSLATVALLTLMACPVQDVELPFGTIPDAENPAFAQVAPEDCLLYLRWSSSRTAEASGATSTEQFFADPEVQSFILSLTATATSAMSDTEFAGNPTGKFVIEKLNKILPELLSNAGVVVVEELPIGADPTAARAAIILELKDSEDEVAELFARASDELFGPAVNRVDWGNGVQYQVANARELGLPESSFGFRDGFLFLTVGDGVADACLENMKSPGPTWLSNLEEELSIENRSYVGRIDLEKALATIRSEMASRDEEAIQAIGFDRLRAIEFSGGLEGGSFLSKSRITSDGDFPSLLLPVGDTPITLADLKSIPATAELAFVWRLRLGDYLNDVIDVVATTDPEAAEELRDGLAGTGRNEGQFAIMRLFDALGETMTFYHCSEEGGELMGFVGMVDIEDVEAVREEEEKVIALMQEMWPKDDEFDPFAFGNSASYRVSKRQFQGETIHYIVPQNFWSFSPFAFAWCVTDEHLLFAPFPQNIKALLARESSHESLADLPQVQAAFEDSDDIAAIMFLDSAELYSSYSSYLQLGIAIMQQEAGWNGADIGRIQFPSGYAMRKHMSPDIAVVRVSDESLMLESRITIPGTDAFAVGAGSGMAAFLLTEVGVDALSLLNPASARDAEGMNRLKQIGLAMHNHHDVYKRLPAAASTDDDGNQLLSWRVQILPFIEQGALYEQFHHDEPWDSEHNRKLIARMPDIYAAPGSEAEEGRTNYLTIRDESSLFPGTDPIRFAGITDGLSNTIMVVEASDDAAVIWTKPDDAVLDPMKPMRLLGGLRKGGFFAVLGDGSVGYFPDSLGAEIINAWIGRNDGVISDFNPHNR